VAAAAGFPNLWTQDLYSFRILTFFRCNLPFKIAPYGYPEGRVHYPLYTFITHKQRPGDLIVFNAQ
jgi:hypothetical protein